MSRSSDVEGGALRKPRGPIPKRELASSQTPPCWLAEGLPLQRGRRNRRRFGQTRDEGISWLVTQIKGVERKFAFSHL